jgi:hypothetical protein
MSKNYSSEQRPENTAAWERILQSIAVQGMAGKIEAVLKMKGEGRELVKMLVEKWAELVNVRSYFPDLTDVFTPDAIFRIEYAHREQTEGSHRRHEHLSLRVRGVLTYISNLVAKHNTEGVRLRHLYNNAVKNQTGLKEILPLLDDGLFTDGRRKPKLYAPEGAPAKKQKNKKKPKQQPARIENPPKFPTSEHVMEYGIPRDDILEGDIVTIEHSGKVKNGEVGMASYRGEQYIDRIYFPDPTHIRIGEDYQDIHLADRVTVVGPVIKIHKPPLPPDTDGILDADLIADEWEILSEDILIDEKGERRQRATEKLRGKATPSAKRSKGTRRIRVSVKRFEEYGIERVDIATVVMNGDLRIGELGYFAVHHQDQFGEKIYKMFAFVCEQDATCKDGYYNGKREPDSVCLRCNRIERCEGSHNATPYGRVCAIERDGQAVEHTLTLRAFDGRL